MSRDKQFALLREINREVGDEVFGPIANGVEKAICRVLGSEAQTARSYESAASRIVKRATEISVSNEGNGLTWKGCLRMALIECCQSRSSARARVIRRAVRLYMLDVNKRIGSDSPNAHHYSASDIDAVTAIIGLDDIDRLRESPLFRREL